MRSHAVATLAIAVAAATPASTARADDIVTGSVVKVEHQEIYVNLGRGRGIADGAPLRLKRTIALRHPVSRATITDWIPIGAATVSEAGERLSRAVVGSLVAEIRVGDIAEIYVDTPDAPHSAPTSPAPAPRREPGPDIDPHTARVLAVFASVSGATLDARIAAWEGFQATYPASPHAAAIADDLDRLRELRDALAPARIRTRDVAPVDVRHAAPSIADRDRPLALVFEIGRPDRVASGWLHYRSTGARTFERTLLRREHDRYLRGEVPADATRGTAVEYFVEVSAPGGDSGTAVGTPAAPISVDVAKPPLTAGFAGDRGRTQLTLSTSYLDFASLDRRDGDRTDRLIVAEVEIRYLFRSWLKGIGAGYGALSGVGGDDAQWTPENPAPRTGYNYGWADVEVGTRHRIPLSIAGRMYAGVGRTGFELGGEGRVRVGAADATNITASVRNLAHIGWLSDLRLETRPRPRVPVGVAVGVLDQPAGGDLGVRLGIDLGYSFGPVTPIARVSWQGRSVDHGGVGGGLGLGFRW